jgi:curved DNA-binding protein CbpA
MALQLDKGLFSADFMDHYAILGVPLDIDPKEIRKVYLQIARRLHPDSSSLTSERDRALASQLLSKWQNTTSWSN